MALTRLGQHAELEVLHLHPLNKEASIMATKPYKQLGCLDVQPSGGCGFQVRAETEAELMQLVATHAKQCHKLDSIPAEMAAQVKAAIKTVTITV
jgi:predicted small metal-binding protein